MVLDKPIYQLTVMELIDVVQDDIAWLKEDIKAGKVKNRYIAQAYVDKLNDFLTLDYFKGGTYQNVRQILGNLKFFLQDSKDQADILERKIEDVKRIKKMNLQMSLFGDGYLLSEKEIQRALKEPEAFIVELKEKLEGRKKDYKLAKFCMAYLVNHNNFFQKLYGRK